MILGFAHLTLASRQIERAIDDLKALGFVMQTVHRGIPSSPAKWPLMAFQARRHDLALLTGPVAMEIVSHETGSVDEPAVWGLKADAATVTLRCADPAGEGKFLAQAFTAAKLDNHIEIRGVFPGWSVRLELVKDASTPASVPLDVEGYSCLAFYSNNIGEDIARLVSLGASCATDEFSITLDGRKIDVAMVRSPSGSILELLKVNRR